MKVLMKVMRVMMKKMNVHEQQQEQWNQILLKGEGNEFSQKGRHEEKHDAMIVWWMLMNQVMRT